VRWRVDQKELQMLAITREERSTLLPDVPTFKKQGIAGDFGIDSGLLVPKEVLEEIVIEVSCWFKKALEDQALIERWAGHGTPVYFRESDAFT
jgi:tripartite-type tricarboxylate transporter receptor subunit TctC